MRQAVEKCRAQAIKLFTFKPANQTGAICFKTCKCMNRFGFFRSESERSQSKHRQWAQQRGVYMTTVHVDTTVTLCSRRRETSSGSRLTSTPWPPRCQSLGNARRALRKPNKEQMKLQTVGRKETKQKKREKTAREQEQGGSIHGHKASAAEQTRQWE